MRPNFLGIRREGKREKESVEDEKRTENMVRKNYQIVPYISQIFWRRCRRERRRRRGKRSRGVRRRKRGRRRRKVIAWHSREVTLPLSWEARLILRGLIFFFPLFLTSSFFFLILYSFLFFIFSFHISVRFSWLIFLFVYLLIYYCLFFVCDAPIPKSFNQYFRLSYFDLFYL